MLPGLATMLHVQTGGGAFIVSVSPASVTKTGSTKGENKTLTTQTVTVTASGGVGGHSYSWARISGSSLITATAPAAATAAFSATLSPDQQVDAVFRCTVTDAAGMTQHVDVSVTITLVFIDWQGGGSL